MLSNNSLPKFVVSWRSIFIALLVSTSLLALVLYLNYIVFQTRSADSFAVDRQGNIYLAERGTSKIEKYTQSGQLQPQFKPIQKDGAVNVMSAHFSLFAFDSQNNFFTINNLSKTINKYDERGNLLQKINIAGDLTNIPRQLVVDSEGNIYVLFSSLRQGQIRKYTKAGTEVSNFASTIAGLSKLGSLTSLAVDKSDYLYFTSSLSEEVYKLDTITNELISIELDTDLLDSDDYLDFEQMVVDDEGNFYFATYAGSIVKYNWRGAVSALWEASITELRIDTATNSIYGLSNSNGQIRWQKFNSQTGLVGEQKLGTSELDRMLLFFVDFSLGFLLLSWWPLLVIRRDLAASDYPTTETIRPPRLQQMLSDPRTIYDSLNLQLLTIRKSGNWAQGIGLGVGLGVAFGVFSVALSLLFVFTHLSPREDIGLVILVLLFIAAGGFLVSLATWIERLNQSQSRNYGGILQETLSTFPNSCYASSEAEYVLNEKLRGRYQYIFFGLLTFLGAGSFLVVRNNTTLWVWEVAFISCVGISWLLTLLITNVLATLQPQPSEAKLTKSELVDLSWRLALPFLLLLLVTIGLGKLCELLGGYQNDNSSLVFWGLGTLTLIKYSTAQTYLSNLCGVWVSRSFIKEDYATALRKARFMEQRSANLGYSCMQVAAHVSEGFFAEAEQQTFAVLVRGAFWKTEQLAILLEQLVFLRAYEGRYAEAFYLMEKSIQLDPNRPLGYANLAEIYLRMMAYPTRAFALLEHVTTNQATRQKQPKLTSKDMLLNRAWALAQLGRLGEADAIVQNALANTEKEPRHWLSSMYFRAARIKELQNQPAAAIQYYQQIIQITPSSHYGQWAKQLLEAHQQKHLV